MKKIITVIFYILLLSSNTILAMQFTQSTQPQIIKTPESVRRERETKGMLNLWHVVYRLIDDKKIAIEHGEQEAFFISNFLKNNGIACSALSNKTDEEIKKMIFDWYNKLYVIKNRSTHEEQFGASGVLVQTRLLSKSGAEPIEAEHENDDVQEDSDDCIFNFEN